MYPLVPVLSSLLLSSLSLPSPPPPPPPPPGESLNFKAIYTRKEEEEEERKRGGRRLGARVELYTTLRTGGRVVAAPGSFVSSWTKREEEKGECQERYRCGVVAGRHFSILIRGPPPPPPPHWGPGGHRQNGFAKK